MKKFLLILMVVMTMFLTACGGQRCTECGKRVKDGYEIFGRFMCEDCFW